MPRAVDIASTQKFDLKTLPPTDNEEGGYVVIRRMNQGEKMQRQGRMSGMKVLGRKGSKDFEGELALANQRVTEFEFATCVVEHNLTNAADQPLDLHDARQLATLDGKVGEEIGVYIDQINQFSEEDDDTGN